MKIVGGRAWGLNSEGSSKVAEARARWDIPAAGCPGGGECGTAKPRTQRNQEGRRGGGSPAAGRRPGGQRGSPESRGRPLRQAEEQGGRDTHKFLRFAAVAARRRQLIRAPTLLLVPGPAAGPLAPAGRLHVLG